MPKILVAQYDPDIRCFAEEGEELTVAPPSLRKPKGFPKDGWFFLGTRSGQPSRYGWVEDAPDPHPGPCLPPVAGVDPGDEARYAEMLREAREGIERTDAGKPVVCEWFEYGMPPSVRVRFRVHRVFFTLGPKKSGL